MATTVRHRYVKLALFEACTTQLTGGTIVGQTSDWVLVERPQPKPRATAKPRTKKANSSPKATAATQSATAFPPPDVKGA